MINGNEYAWEDITVILPGSVTAQDGVVAIKYKTKKDHTNVYARGDKPVAMGRGKKEYTSSITMLQSLVESLQAGLPAGKDLTDIAPFTVTVGYAPEGGVATVDQLLFVRIADYEKGMKTGDGNMTVECEIVPGDIKYNV